MADVSVRAARLPDVSALSRVQIEAWQASGLPGVPDPAETERAWERAVMVPPSPRHRLLVALDREDVVGVAATVPAPDPDLAAGLTSELVLLAVAPDRRGAGHGSRLLAAAVELARSSGEGCLVAWVPARDDRTRTFLTGAGWAADGAHRTTAVDDESGAVRWVRLATDLTEEPAP